jgi:glutathionyl-hydroquinone reductase
VPGLTVRSIKGLEKDQAKFDDTVSKLSAVLQVYETILGKQKYLAGDVSPASSTDS